MSSVAPTRAAIPLCVDLDGTLIRSDLLWESVVVAVKRAPWTLLQIPFWLLRGRARLKHEIARRGPVEAATLPYDEAFLTFLREQAAAGRRLCLVTAANQALAARVAAHLGLFEVVIASDATTNLAGRNKAAALVDRFGAAAFDYAGNSTADLHVWPHCRQALSVNSSAALSQRVRKGFRVEREFPQTSSPFRALLRALRPHQWVKNLIVAVPLVTSHQLFAPPIFTAGLLAVAAFCLCASAIYLSNDLLDLEADRRHPAKHRRPLAAGALPLPWAFLAIPLLATAALALAFRISPAFGVVLALYAGLSLAYSWRLKQTALLDVLVLAALYTIRLIAGHAATGIRYSEWLLAFSMFFFVSLALVKRYQEILAQGQGAETQWIPGRGYLPSDLSLLASFGAASGMTAVLVMALYVSSEQVRLLYRQPLLLLLICPLLLYWIGRVWLHTHRGKMHDDPVVFALRDRVSYLLGLLTAAVIWLAT